MTEKQIKRCFDCKLIMPLKLDCNLCKIDNCYHYESEIKELKEIIKKLTTKLDALKVIKQICQKYMK